MVWREAFSAGGALLAQIADPNKSLSSDLRWLRFPQSTTETITMFFAALVGIVLAVIGTLLVQAWVQPILDKLPSKRRSQPSPQVQRLEPELREALARLLPEAGVHAPEDLLHDPAVFEQAVERYVAAAPLTEDLGVFTRLRRALGQSAMNIGVKIVSTRQLLPDLIVRLVATIGTDRLDLYCPLLEVGERYFMIDMPYQKEVFAALTAHPDVFLHYWREHDGETAFQVRLMPIHSGHISAFRCMHALRSEAAGARESFRLTMDLPVSFQFVGRDALAQHPDAVHHHTDIAPIKGEAKLVDLSDGGAAILCDTPLSVRGFAQLHFTLRDADNVVRPVRVMMEVLKQDSAPGGKTVARGHFRGMNPEMRGLIHASLTREQFKRIQLRQHIVVHAETPPMPEKKAAAPPGDKP